MYTVLSLYIVYTPALHVCPVRVTPQRLPAVGVLALSFAQEALNPKSLARWHRLLRALGALYNSPAAARTLASGRAGPLSDDI